MSNTKENDNKVSKSWLQRLKEESWEAELLVSAVAIFGSFQLFGIIDWLTNFFIDWLSPSQYYVGYMIVFFGLIAISILSSMFVLHFVLRAYWVGLVGLNSVFPDYSLEDSAYSKIYTEKILAILPKLKDSINKVDELCSVIFSVAFTFMGMYGYMAFLSSVLLLLYNFLSSFVSIKILTLALTVIGVLLIFQILLSIVANIKMFKESRSVQVLYFNVMKWSSYLMLGPLYKSFLQVTMIFGSNFKKKKSMIYLLLSFLVLGFIVSISQFNKTNIPYLINHEKYFDGMWIRTFYASENEQNEFLLSPEIEADIVKNKLVKIFIPIFNNERRIRKNICGDYIKNEKVSEKAQSYNKRKNKLECYNAYNFVNLNDEKVAVTFLKYDHPRTKQFGVLGYVKLESVKEGMNILTVNKIFDNTDNNKQWKIPFYYVAK